MSVFDKKLSRLKNNPKKSKNHFFEKKLPKRKKIVLLQKSLNGHDAKIIQTPVIIGATNWF